MSGAGETTEPTVICTVPSTPETLEALAEAERHGATVREDR